MIRSWKSWGFVAVITCLGTVEVVAGETSKFEFDGWTVSITPRKQAAPKPKTITDPTVALQRPVRQANLVSKQTPLVSNEQGVVIRPASYLQTDPTPAPAPAPVPELNPAPTPAPAPQTVETNQPTKIEVPVLQDSASSVVAPAQPSAACKDCSPPLIIPRSRSEIVKEQQPINSMAASYRDIYFAIPFNRAEYNANPSYRHEATMEILFNQLRPTVIQRSNSNSYNYNYNNGGGGPYGNATYPFYPYGYPYLLLHTVD